MTYPKIDFHQHFFTNNINHLLAVDEALTKGSKYVDGWSGERIGWLEGASLNQRTAVLLNKNTDVIDTVYNQKEKKLKWLKSNWQYKGDIK